MNNSNRYRRLCEHNNFFVVPKGRLRLKEDTDDSNAYVEPDSNNQGSSASLASDLSKTAAENPNDDTFIFNTKSYDGNSSTQQPTIDINAQNATDAANQYNKMTQNQDVNRLIKNGGCNVKVHMESIEYKRVNSIPFTKAELNKMLK